MKTFYLLMVLIENNAEFFSDLFCFFCCCFTDVLSNGVNEFIVGFKSFILLLLGFCLLSLYTCLS